VRHHNRAAFDSELDGLPGQLASLDGQQRLADGVNGQAARDAGNAGARIKVVRDVHQDNGAVSIHRVDVVGQFDGGQQVLLDLFGVTRRGKVRQGDAGRTGCAGGGLGRLCSLSELGGDQCAGHEQGRQKRVWVAWGLVQHSRLA